MKDTVILVSNDDGYGSPGIEALSEALEPLGEVWVVAPDGERSTSSHALTLRDPVAVRQMGERRYAVDGWPADCAYLGLFGLLPKAPDLVVSGINRGANLGTDVLYSGTVAAAREAYTRGVDGIALSLVKGKDYSLAASVARELAARVIRYNGAPMLLNVNVPGPEARGLRVARLGRKHYPENLVVDREDGEKTFYRLSSVGEVRDALIPGTDGEALRDGFVSVTPLQIDTTSEQHFGATSVLMNGAWAKSVGDGPSDGDQPS